MSTTHRTQLKRLVLAIVVLLLTGCGNGDHPMGPGMMGGRQNGEPPVLTPVPTATAGGSATVSYQRDIQPIFTQNCVSCHGGSAGLWLDSYERVMAGSDRGPVIAPPDPDGSELYRRITGQKQPQMPLNGQPLSQRQIDAIRTWILEGAPNN